MFSLNIKVSSRLIVTTKSKLPFVSFYFILLSPHEEKSIELELFLFWSKWRNATQPRETKIYYFLSSCKGVWERDD